MGGAWYDGIDGGGAGIVEGAVIGAASATLLYENGAGGGGAGTGGAGAGAGDCAGAVLVVTGVVVTVEAGSGMASSGFVASIVGASVPSLEIGGSGGSSLPGAGSLEGVGSGGRPGCGSDILARTPFGVTQALANGLVLGLQNGSGIVIVVDFLLFVSRVSIAIA